MAKTFSNKKRKFKKNNRKTKRKGGQSVGDPLSTLKFVSNSITDIYNRKFNHRIDYKDGTGTYYIGDIKKKKAKR